MRQRFGIPAAINSGPTPRGKPDVGPETHRRSALSAQGAQNSDKPQHKVTMKVWRASRAVISLGSYLNFAALTSYLRPAAVLHSLVSARATTKCAAGLTPSWPTWPFPLGRGRDLPQSATIARLPMGHASGSPSLVLPTPRRAATYPRECYCAGR